MPLKDFSTEDTPVFQTKTTWGELLERAKEAQDDIQALKVWWLSLSPRPSNDVVIAFLNTMVLVDTLAMRIERTLEKEHE